MREKGRRGEWSSPTYCSNYYCVPGVTHCKQAPLHYSTGSYSNSVGGERWGFPGPRDAPAMGSPPRPRQRTGPHQRAPRRPAPPRPRPPPLRQRRRAHRRPLPPVAQPLGPPPPDRLPRRPVPLARTGARPLPPSTARGFPHPHPRPHAAQARPRGAHPTNAASVDSLLRASARLEPEEFIFELGWHLLDHSPVVHLPCFHRATSIVLDLSSAIRSVPAGVEFAALETLSLSYCTADIDGLLSCCPRLRTLRLTRVMLDKPDLQVNSPLLQELILDTPQGHGGWIQLISIVAPVLEQLTMSFSAPRGSISILAPMVKKVRWHCDFRGVSVAFNLWAIQQLTLQTAEGQGHLPSLRIHASARFYISLDEEDIITPEIEKHMVAEFSVLELHLKTNGHVFGAFAFHLLGMNQICSAMQRLKVVLRRSEVEERCSPHCPCESMGWRSQTISLAALEEVEIDGFGGDDHEIDFLKLIFRCAPLLKRVTVKLPDGASSTDDGCTNIYNIFKAHSCMELYVYLSSGVMLGWQNCSSG